VSRPIARYRPSRRYATFALLALAAGAASVWAAFQWGWAWALAAGLFVGTALFMAVLAWRPVIEIHETYLQVGERTIFWNEIRRADRVVLGRREAWPAPLLVRLTLPGGEEYLLLHPGDADSCISLLRHIYRYARAALLDGVPYAQFWGESAPPASAPRALPRPRLLLAEDEEEVERLYRRLKASGRLDDADPSAAGRSPDVSRGSDEP
jgi:hypothetical protein